MINDNNYITINDNIEIKIMFSLDFSWNSQYHVPIQLCTRESESL